MKTKYQRKLSQTKSKGQLTKSNDSKDLNNTNQTNDQQDQSTNQSKLEKNNSKKELFKKDQENSTVDELEQQKMQKQKGRGMIGDYYIFDKIEKGTTAQVLQCENENGDKFAVKVFNDEQIFNREVQILLNLGKHPNIVQIHDILQDVQIKIYNKDRIHYRNAIVMELGVIDLFTLLSRRQMSGPTARYYFTQLQNAIQFCHSQGIAHCDIKPENIIFDKFGTIKLIDFGMSQQFDQKNKGFDDWGELGTLNYMAPEMHRSPIYNVKDADQFALGIILFIMHTGQPPFENTKQNRWYDLLTQNPEEYSKNIYDLVERNEKDFSDLIINMLARRPNKRIASEAILNHPWFNHKTNTYEKVIKELFM